MADTLRRLRADWPVYGRGLLVLLAALLVVGIVVGYKTMEFRDSRQQRDRLTLDMSARQAEAADVDAKLDLLNRELADYGWVVKHGLLNPESRLDWVETLARQRQQAGKIKIGFSVTPQSTFDWAPTDSSFEIRSSHMVLTTHAKHEGWWLELMDALNQQSKGYPVVRKCHLQVDIISGATNSGDDFKPFTANCDLDWLSITRRATPGGP